VLDGRSLGPPRPARELSWPLARGSHQLLVRSGSQTSAPVRFSVD
jgi:hypothetical protein